ncbi:MAG: hypothetical protein IPM51_12930 [Sphingobacteriaceae bacterium]|nr:hypothetical protein [Sphingobacteriaceae bacterium]
MFNRLLFLFFIPLSLIGTNDSLLQVFKKTELKLQAIEKGFLSKIEKERIETNKKYLSAWNEIISNPQIINYSFDSLKEVSILVPKDKKFMLITWNLFKDDGTHAFFGYLLVNNSKRIKKGFLKHETIEAYEHFTLIDQSPLVKSPETYIGNPGKWFGMLYYSVIPCDGYYTLIGFDPNDKLVSRKFIDVLYFRSNGVPVFGKDVFKFAKKNPRRLMFEYSADISMSVKYNEKRGQIIYSHLAPRKEGDILEGIPQYYGPDGSFDALELKKGKWVTVEDVDIRKEKTKNDKAKKPDPKEQKPVYSPK